MSATELCWILGLSREIICFFRLRLPFALGRVDINRVLAIAEPNSSQQFVVGLEFTGSGKKKICQLSIYIFLFSYSVLVDYSSCISPGHVDPLSVESVSAEMGVHSPIFFLTVYSTAICILLRMCLVQR